MKLLSSHLRPGRRVLAIGERGLRDQLTGGELVTDEVVAGVTRLRLSSRLSRLQGMEVSPYLVAGELLIDSGFAHVRPLVLEYFADRTLRAICCTHHHEDHVGNCGPLAAAHGCPVYLQHAEQRHEEGVARLPAYRQLWWGPPAPYDPQPMPAVIEGVGYRVRAIPTPGHSVSHVALFEEQRGVLFSGDLYVSTGASAVMSHENPYELARSLRRVASLSPALMLTGHGARVPQPESWLCTKASRIEEAAQLAVMLHDQGVGEDEIVRRLFPARGRTRDIWARAMTGGEFSRRNFVRAAIAHWPQEEAAGPELPPPDRPAPG